MYDLREKGLAAELKRFLVILLTMALLGTYVIPANVVIAESGDVDPTPIAADAEPVIEDGGGEPAADPVNTAPPADTLDPADPADPAGPADPADPAGNQTGPVIMGDMPMGILGGMGFGGDLSLYGLGLPMYTVTFSPGANTGAFAQSTEVELGSPTPAPPAFNAISNNYVFIGWSTPIASVVTDNTTYTAQWLFAGGGYRDNLDPASGYNVILGKESTARGRFFIVVLDDQKNVIALDRGMNGYNASQQGNNDNNCMVAGANTGYTFNVLLTSNQNHQGSNDTSGSIRGIGSNNVVPPNFTLAYDANGGAGAPAAQTVPRNTNAAVSTIKPARADHEFIGWSLSRDGSVQYEGNGNETILMDGNKTLYAIWKIVAPVKHTVTYDPNGGIGGPNSPDDAYLAGANVTVRYRVPTLEGFTFLGWSYDGKTYQPGNIFKMPANNVTLVAQWKANVYAVTYDANGGIGGPNSPDDVYLKDASVTVRYRVPTQEGFTFLGWSFNKVAGEGETLMVGGKTFTMPAKNVILYAQWERDPDPEYFIVFYNENYDGKLNFTDPNAFKYEAGDRVTVTAIVPDDRDGYEFDGWTFAQDGTGTVYADGDTFFIPAYDVILYAQWTLEEYRIEYLLDDGVNDPRNPMGYTILDTPLQIFNPTKEGFTFDGWSLGGEEPGNVVLSSLGVGSFSPFATMTKDLVIPVGSVGSITLIANWSEDTGTITTPITGGPTGGGGGGPAVVAATIAALGAGPADPVVIAQVDPPLAAPSQIADEQTPLAPVTITPEQPPLASYSAWALLNLVLTILTGLIMIALMATYFHRRREEDEDVQDFELTVKKNLAPRLMSIAAAVVALVIFLATQDMTLPMIMADKWTIWHIMITAAALVLAIFSKKSYEVEEFGYGRA